MEGSIFAIEYNLAFYLTLQQVGMKYLEPLRLFVKNWYQTS